MILYFSPSELLIAVLLGLVMGSFVSAVSHRLPLGMDVVCKPSHCTACLTKLGLRDLIPVVSWVLARGRCRACKAQISWRYPAIELAMAVCFALIYCQAGLSVQALLLALITTALMIHLVTDFEHGILPDSVQAVLLVLAVAYVLSQGIDVETWATGAFVGALTGFGLRYGFYVVTKREGLGWGDVKFLPIAGLLLGAKPFVLYLIASGILGISTALLWRALKRGPEFPFGPALIISLFVMLLYAENFSRLDFLFAFYNV